MNDAQIEFDISRNDSIVESFFKMNIYFDDLSLINCLSIL